MLYFVEIKDLKNAIGIRFFVSHLEITPMNNVLHLDRHSS